MRRVEVSGQRHRENWGGDLVLRVFGRWFRFAAYYGTPPGSHIGIWRTRMGEMIGINLRVGRRYVGPTLTTFVHTRPLRAFEREQLSA